MPDAPIEESTALIDAVGRIASAIWGVPFMLLLAGTGVFLTIRLRGLQFRKLGRALAMARPGAGRASKDGESTGDISNFQALMTALSATVGTGNIAGVATAIATGGPGAIFWLWLLGLIGMATKFAEAVLAVHYRVTNERGEMSGGPMYYISRGLKGHAFARPLAVMFAVCTVAASLLGIGCPVQSNSIADAMQASFGIEPWIVGIVLMVATGAVLFGGIKSIGRVTAVLVPTMIAGYLLSALVVLVLFADRIPNAFGLIFRDAFTGSAATGGFVGASVMLAIRAGVSRGLFSNESGLGSAPIAAAAARTDHPVQQALVSMTQTFIDTLVVCSVTALVLLVSGVWNSGATGAALTSAAFEEGFRGGSYVVSIGLLLFAWSTMLGWSYYGEKALAYLTGPWVIVPFRVLFVLVVGIGAVADVELVWIIGDIFNGLMALPNLVALLLLSPVVVRLANEYFARDRS